MPFANYKFPQGTLTAKQKEEIIHKTTSLFAEYFGEGVRSYTMVLVDEVVDGDMPELVHKGHDVMAPAGSDVADVARAIAKVVDIPFGKRPFHVTIDPADAGAEVINMMGDRVRTELFRRIGMEDLLKPHQAA